MNDPRIIPAAGDQSVVTYTILVDDTEVPPTIEVVSFTTEKASNRIPMAKLELRDGDAAAEDFPVSNGAEFVPGAKIELKVGYASEETTVFKGIVVKQRIRVRDTGSSALVVECRDEAVRMSIGRRNRYHVDKTDSDVMEELIGEYNLTADVEPTSLSHKDLVQFHVTDWDFLVTRAESVGSLVLVDDGTVTVKPPEMEGEEALSVIYGDTVFELDAEIDARYQYNSVTATAWDAAAQDLVTQDATASGNAFGNLDEATLAGTIGLDAYTLAHTGQVDPEELSSWANGQSLRSSLAKVVGRLRTRGFANIKPGQILSLEGVGERFSGSGFVAAVRQEVSVGTWYTEIQFGLPPTSHVAKEDLPDLPAAGLVPGVNGLQVGIATALEGDPDGEDRIQVRLPIVDPAADGIWARWAAPDAGDQRGVFFRPEIEDELVVGFLNGDPRDPVVLGMLHSSQHPSPIALSDDNHEKAIVTRENMRVHFDDENKVITIDTPGGNSVVLSDNDEAITLTDQHSNSITMNSDGITLQASNITLNADQEVAINAGTDLKGESGANTEITAGAQVAVEGSAGADFKSSAIVTIEGSLVKIN